MKKLIYLFVAVVFVSFAACKKDYPVEPFTPASNTWLINTDTFGPATFVYYDTAGLMYGGVKGKGSITFRFRNKPKADGKYVLRAIADEPNEVSILAIDSVRNLKYVSTDNDGSVLKVEQFANILGLGSRVGVAFNEVFLTRMDNTDIKAKVSVNIE